MMIRSNDRTNTRGGSIRNTAQATQQEIQNTSRLTALQHLEIAQAEWKKF
jgi:hypothetical protein